MEKIKRIENHRYFQHDARKIYEIRERALDTSGWKGETSMVLGSLRSDDEWPEGVKGPLPLGKRLLKKLFRRILALRGVLQ